MRGAWDGACYHEGLMEEDLCMVEMRLVCAGRVVSMCGTAA